MVQFTLPKNSKMSEGKVWPVPAGGHRTTAFRIYRWDPDDGQNPRWTPTTSTATIAGRWCSTR